MTSHFHSGSNPASKFFGVFFYLFIPSCKTLDLSPSKFSKPEHPLLVYIQPATRPHSWVLTSRAALSLCSHVRLFAILWTVGCQAPLSIGFSSKNTAVGCHFLLQGIFPTQGSNPCVLSLLHWQAGSLPLAPPGKPGASMGCFLCTKFSPTFQLSPNRRSKQKISTLTKEALTSHL